MCFNSSNVLAVLDEMGTGVLKKSVSLWKEVFPVQFLLILSHIHSLICLSVHSLPIC